MPPVDLDLDAPVSVCTTDRKIACADDDDDSSSQSSDAGDEDFTQVPHDFPAESFWLSQDAEFDWFDRNAFLERKESTRGNICNNSANSNQCNNTTSQRFSKHLNSKAAILGMPNTQKSNYVDKRRQSKAPIMRLFPSKRSESIKSTAAMTEPSSPKVSCIGRVRSKKGRRRKVTVKAVVERTRSADQVEKKKKGFYSGLKSLFRSDRRCTNKGSVRITEPVCRKKSEVGKKRDEAVVVSCESESEPVSLGGTTRFVSGRRSESWIVGEESDVARKDSLEAVRKSGSTRRP